MAEEKTYQIIIQCTNCGLIRKEPVMVLKGRHWNRYLEEYKIQCKNCGICDCYCRTT